MKEDYFFDHHEKIIFQAFEEYYLKYNTTPTYEAMFIDIANKKINEDVFENVKKTLSECKKTVTNNNEQWLIDTTEEFCKNQCLHLALIQSINIADGTDKKLEKGAIPDILKDALSVSFNTSLGHDYLGDYKSRFDYYHLKENKIAFGISTLDEITNGGMSPKTLNIIIAPPGGGKSAIMSNVAAASLQSGKNVLYISLEMSEEEISKRIDVNLMDVTFDELQKLEFSSFEGKILDIKRKTTGRLKIQEYPTGAASVTHFRALLNELELKQDFKPDLIIVDYLGLMASAKVKNTSANSFTIVKSISEELRGLAVEKKIPILSASQFNREAAGSSDPSETGVSESFGIIFTVDFAIAIYTNDTLKEMGKIMAKQLKSRYRDKSMKEKFELLFNREKMRIEGIDQFASPPPKAKSVDRSEKMKGLKV